MNSASQGVGLASGNIVLSRVFVHPLSTFQCLDFVCLIKLNARGSIVFDLFVLSESGELK